MDEEDEDEDEVLYDDEEEEEEGFICEMSTVTPQLISDDNVIESLMAIYKNTCDSASYHDDIRKAFLSNISGDPTKVKKYVTANYNLRLGDLFTTTLLGFNTKLDPKANLLALHLNKLKAKYVDFGITNISATVISWQVRIAYTNFDFGKFVIMIRNPFTSPSYYSYLVSENTIKSGCPHPHINYDGQVCIGTYKYEVDKDLMNFDVLKVIETITDILHDYNADSVFVASLEEWVGRPCKICGESIPDGEELICDKTHIFMHEDCSVKIGRRYYSPLVVKKCEKCNVDSVDWVLSNSKIICTKCRSKPSEMHD